MPAAPSWLTNAPPFVWKKIPGTDVGNVAAVFAGGGDPDVVLIPWCGAAYDTSAGAVLLVANGGHTDYDGNEAYKLDCTQESCSWVLLMTPSGAAAASDVQNGSGARGDGSKVADHGYNLCQYANGKVFFPAIGAMAGATGNTSTAVWYWNEVSRSDSTRGYTNLGLADAAYDFTGGGFVESGSCYDPVAGKIYRSAQTWNVSANSICTIDHSAPYAITNFNNINIGTGEIPFQLLCHSTKRWIVALGQAGLLTMDIAASSLSFAVATESGTALRTKSAGAVIDESAQNGEGIIYCWSGGDFLTVLRLPQLLTGTFAWSKLPVLGTAPTEATNGTWKKMGLLTLGGIKMIVFLTDSHTAVYFIRISERTDSVRRPATTRFPDYLSAANDEDFANELNVKAWF